MDYYYFASAIRKRMPEQLAVSKKIVGAMSEYGKVLTEHVVRDDVHEWEAEQNKLGVNVYERDMRWLCSSRKLVIEASAATTGGGYELGKSAQYGMPALVLWKKGSNISNLVYQNTHPLVEKCEYDSDEEAVHCVHAFMQAPLPVQPGLFIAIEGIDGSGKTTQTESLTKNLFNAKEDHNKRKSVLLTREPYNSPHALKIRSILKDELADPYAKAELLTKLFVKDREYHIDMFVLPQRNQGHIIITDRYEHSTLAYQQTQGMPLAKLLSMHEHLPRADITFLFDVDPEIAAGRIAQSRGRAEKEMFDKLDFQRILRQKYLELADILPNITVLDASQPIPNLEEQILEEVKKRIAW